MKPADPGNRVTMRDIAQALKLSQPTVSRALRNDPQISKRVIDLVRKTAEKMGYRPDPFLSALITYRLQKSARPIAAEIAWLNAWDDPAWLRFFKEFDLYWQGAFSEAERAGYRLEEFRFDSKTSAARLTGILHARNIQGVLIPPFQGNIDWTGFSWDRFSVVRFNLGEEFPHAHRVSSDQIKVGQTLYEEAAKRGYRRIGFVTSRYGNNRPKRFIAGYSYAQTNTPPSQQLPPLQLNRNSSVPDQQQLKEWFKANKPDAILTDERDMRSLLHDIGVSVPGDVAMAHTTVLDGCANAGIDQNSNEIGRAAVQMLISLINHQELGLPETCRELLLDCRWVDGSDMPDRRR